MLPRRSTLHRTALALEQQLDRYPLRTAGRRVLISPYRSFGRAGELIVRGRVLVAKTITRATTAESLWRNLLNTWRRFQSDEVAGARVRATFGTDRAEGVTNDEGYFEIRLHPPHVDQDLLWQEVQLELPDSGVTAVEHVLVPGAGAEFGVISDIDDTVVVTNATSIPGMVSSVIRNAASRLPFEGVADLYRALHRGRNPLFYVSSSPWNLYELLHDFMDVNGIPHGPMLLQDWGLDETTLLIAAHRTHKLQQIQRLLDYYPALPFILIGDSGQHDPEIYLDVIKEHRSRIRAAIIRDVSPDVRDRVVAAMAAEANAAGVEMLYVRDSGEAAAEAKRLGLV